MKCLNYQRFTYTNGTNQTTLELGTDLSTCRLGWVRTLGIILLYSIHLPCQQGSLALPHFWTHNSKWVTSLPIFKISQLTSQFQHYIAKTKPLLHLKDAAKCISQMVTKNKCLYLTFQTDMEGKCLCSVLKATFDESVYLNHYHHWTAIIIISSLYTTALILPNCSLSKQNT